MNTMMQEGLSDQVLLRIDPEGPGAGLSTGAHVTSRHPVVSARAVRQTWEIRLGVPGS